MWAEEGENIGDRLEAGQDEERESSESRKRQKVVRLEDAQIFLHLC